MALGGCGSSSPSESDKPAQSSGAPKPAASSNSDLKGTLVYVKRVGADQQLFTMRADGTGERQLTEVDGNAMTPEWAPDGEHVAFMFEHSNEENPYCSIAAINADGSGFKDLGPYRRGCSGGPGFSSDGKHIAFGRFDDVKKVEVIATMRSDGSAPRFIEASALGGGVINPQFSPDGKWITFVRLAEEGHNSLYAIRPDGSDVRRLMPKRWELGEKHEWSPDGELISVTTFAHKEDPNQSANVVTIHPDGKIATRITRFADGIEHGFAGSFSPDGKQIVIRLEKGDKYRLAVVDRDGRNLRPITPFGDDERSHIGWAAR